MALLPDIWADPTLAEIDRIAEAEAAAEPRRDYLGASIVGHECDRFLWYSIRPDVPRLHFRANTLRRFEDGHRTEALVIDRLRRVPGVEVWDRQDDGNQIGGKLLAGRFGWHVDGVILGLLQSPKTPHVLEVKATGEKKFKEFRDAVVWLGEKQALQAWNPVYYAQAVIYMYLLDLTRHYTVVASAGGREMASCRTEAKTELAKALLAKAERILSATEAPARLSERREFYKCKFCDFRDVCHA
jgi:CRISPR/Cas system-associated exonuclease Cas4 (RecB family)